LWERGLTHSNKEFNVIMESGSFSDEDSDNFEDSSNEEEDYAFIVAERVEGNNETGKTSEVEEEVKKFIESYRVKSENNIQAILSKIKDQDQVFAKKNKDDLHDADHILGGAGYHQDECEQRKMTEKHEETVEIIENVKKEFLAQQHSILDYLAPETDYIICQELECPVCLTEMVPPTRIWQCSAGHAICQNCKRNKNIKKKCPTCRQAIIGRATTLEKMAASLFKKKTGKEIPEVDDHDNDDDGDDDDEPEDEEDSEDITATDVLHMLYLPMRHHARGFRSPVGTLEDEISRLINNISFIQHSRNSELL